MNTHFPSHPRSTPFRVDWKVYLSARDTPTSAKVLKKLQLQSISNLFIPLIFNGYLATTISPPHLHLIINEL